MDPEFEFVEEIKETEAERLQRLVRTTDSVSILHSVCKTASNAVLDAEGYFAR